MTESEKDLIIRLWESGKTIKEIILFFPYPKDYLRNEVRELKKQGVLVGRSGKTKQKTTQKMLDLYNDGIRNPYEIASRLNVCPKYVNNRLSSCHLSRGKPKQNYKPKSVNEKTAAIINDIKNGKKIKEIASSYDISRQYVYAIKNKYVKE